MTVTEDLSLIGYSQSGSIIYQDVGFNQWLQDNRHTSYEAEDARARARGGVYYSPPGTSYTIVERPASSHGHHAQYSQHHYPGGKLSRAPYLGSSTIANNAGTNPHIRSFQFFDLVFKKNINILQTYFSTYYS